MIYDIYYLFYIYYCIIIDFHFIKMLLKKMTAKETTESQNGDVIKGSTFIFMEKL